MQNEDDDFEDGVEGDTALSAARAAERMERLKWIQERKQLEVEQAQQEQQEHEAEVDTRVETDGTSRVAAPIRRFNSRAAPALAAFSRQLSGVKPSAVPKINTEAEAGADGGEEVDPATGAAGGAKRWRNKVNAATAFSLTRRSNSMLGGSSLRGPGGQPDVEEVGGGKDKEGKIAITRNFFFQKIQKDDPNAIVDEAPVSNLLPLPPGASTGTVAPKRSSTGAGFTKRKGSAGGAAPMKRQKSTLLSALTD